jgi:hypothetical protein
VPQRRLQPHQVWLIGIPLNLLLSIPAWFPLMFILLAGQVIAGQLGWTAVDPTLIDDGVGLPIVFGVLALVLSAGAVVVLNLFAFWAHGLNRTSYWVAVFLMLLIPNLFLLETR